MATVLCCGRQKPLGTHGDSSSQGPRGSRPAVSSPRAAHTGPLERGPQSHRPPGRPTPQGGRGGRTRLRLARHGGLCSGPLGTVSHLGFQTPSPGCVSVRSLGQNVLICSMAFPPTSHWPCGSHPPGSVDVTSLGGGGKRRTLLPPASSPCSVGAGIVISAIIPAVTVRHLPRARPATGRFARTFSLNPLDSPGAAVIIPILQMMKQRLKEVN